ncbi:ABC transporter ATP-binding protein/permease [Actinocorallia sp. API 0066]|uniref:ATP-binding cassette domain-containing protein n=1 Tax=Actinocorallia sp. API 0066 TaxID=2896846 RepID=UPI001E5ADD98|nr:ABC transporter ATP-binding protein [Actinocorallia sp. API 0066]MCD0451624.1 ABC transporter ATP-binding protein/permease [Actinocorallia sp. API 0066]
MRRYSTLLGFYRESWRSDRRLVGAFAGLLLLDVLATGGFAGSMHALLKGALAGDVVAVVVATMVGSVSWTVSILGVSARMNMIYLLSEADSVRVDEQILALIARREGIEHLESPEYADQVALARGAGDLIARSAWVLVDGVAALVRLVVVLVVFALISPVLLLLAALLVPAVWLLYRSQRAARRSVVASARDARLAEHLHRLATEPVSGREILVAGAGEALRARERRTWDRLIRRQERGHWTAAAIATVGWALFAGGYTVALLLLIRDVTRGHAGPADVIVLVTLTGTLRVQAEGIVRSLQRMSHGISALDAFTWLREHSGPREAALPAVPEAAPEDRHLPRLRDGITMNRVSFAYPGTSETVVREVTLKLPAGATVAFVGEYGAGKTTLVKLLCGMYEPTEGTIAVDGVPLAEFAPRDWWRHLTANFQDFARFRLVARESVGIGDLAALGRPDRIARAVADADAEEVVERLPAGLDTQLGAEFDGVELSTGQWQRVALARTRMREAPLLCVIDEPTASLDARGEYVFYRRQMVLARALAEAYGTVTLVVSHRFSTVRMADLIVVVDDGVVTDLGTHEDLIAREGTYSTLYRMQADAYRIS